MKPKHPGRVPEYLQHILEAIDRATSYIKGMDLTSFEGDTRTQDAVIRSIEIIGEAANKTRIADPDFAARHPSRICGRFCYRRAPQTLLFYSALCPLQFG